MSNLNHLYCSKLYSTSCCPNMENFWFLKDDPRTTDKNVCKVYISACCKHIHEVNQLPLTSHFYSGTITRQVRKSNKRDGSDTDAFDSFFDL